jgi:hypothetical protein
MSAAAQATCQLSASHQFLFKDNSGMEEIRLIHKQAQILTMSCLETQDCYLNLTALRFLNCCRVASSPDTKYLLASWLNRPFSTSVPAGRFPVEIQVRLQCVPSYFT